MSRRFFTLIYRKANQGAGGNNMTLTPEMARAGVTPQLLSSTHRFTCPRCGKEFSLFQSRAIACRACPQANRNCKFVRCIHCDNEFQINGFIVNTKEKEKFLSNYMRSVVDNYHTSFGYYRR